MYQYSKELSADYFLSWNITDDIISFEAVVSPGHLCWVGLGFHELGSQDKRMNRTDNYVAVMGDNGTYEIYDAYAPKGGKPPLDTDQGCTDDVIVSGSSP